MGKALCQLQMILEIKQFPFVFNIKFIYFLAPLLNLIAHNFEDGYIRDGIEAMCRYVKKGAAMINKNTVP